MTAALRQSGQRCGKNRVARLMRDHQLAPKQKRKRWRPITTDSSHRQPVAENWLAKAPAPDRPDQVWVADITYIDTNEGWLYLAGLLDACTRRLVGWQAGETLGAELVTRAWQKAVRDRRPAPGLLHHSDRGVQYASGAMAALLTESGAAASMSRQGNCYDNAMMESFWATLKAECFHGERPATRQAAKLQIFDYVESFDNRTRLHSSPRLPISPGVRDQPQVQQKLTPNGNTTVQSTFSEKDHSEQLDPGPVADALAGRGERA